MSDRRKATAGVKSCAPPCAIESRRALEDRSAQLRYVHESDRREVGNDVEIRAADRENRVTARLGPRDGTLAFDLAEGRVHLGGEARVVLPASLVLTIVGAATVEMRETMGRAFGRSIGRVATIRMKEGDFAAPRTLVEADPEAALSELGAAWALAGLGGLGLERWGKALVMTVDQSPFGPEGDDFMALVLASALEEATERRVFVTPLERTRSRLRLFVGNERAVAKIRTEIARDKPWAEVLSRMQSGSKGQT